MSTYTEAHRAYYLANREKILAVRAERERKWLETPRGKFSVQKRKAKQRGIPWELTFEQWWSLWQDSGRWDERNQTGYVMCRTNDEGPYALDNVRIDTAGNNSLENYLLRGVDSLGRFQHG